MKRSVLPEQSQHRNRMHFRVRGAAGSLTTFVLESGGGGMSCEQWKLLEQQLAGSGLVLSYDRAGIGSSAGATSGTGVGAAAVADRLSSLLEEAGMEAPFILVGYSLGGLYARYFAATRPEYVRGLVLIDPTPLSDSDYGRPLTSISVPVSIALVHLMAWGLYLFFRSGLAGLFSRTIGRAPGSALPDFVRRSALFRNHRHVRSVLQELRSMGSIQRAAASKSLPAGLPVLCISAAMPAKSQDLLQRHHKKLAQEGAPPWSRHHVIAGASHGTLVTNSEYSKNLGDHILGFAQHIRAQTRIGDAIR